MRTVLAKSSGFCPGVKRADERIRELIAARPDSGEIYVLGHLIHNRIYNERLESYGVHFISERDIAKTIANNPDKHIDFVIRTHGVSLETEQLLFTLAESNKNVSVHNLTCPFVTRIHRIAKENTDGSTVFLLFGDKDHPENVGTISYANGEKHVFLTEDELQSIDFTEKSPILCSQTTQNIVIFEKNKKILKNLCTNALIYDKICSVTENRQNEAIELSSKSDVMIVIGGRDSSNTRKLYEICSKECEHTYFIQTLDDLHLELPKSVRLVGITAGASTPNKLIEEVQNYVRINF